ncbi:DUF6090 family protein [Algoriphagus sp. SE2]|uniref:DUF6090 family protein n=1 Tax=Algoriphagus sp. SE2 TaxID=3141536 RepID=UPI0031CD17D4
MINFFRKIRQKLLAKNNFRRYLTYAFGEILLVVIGILIAFQLNNWNERQKQLKLENEYYCRLLEDVRLDQVQFTELLRLAQDRLTASNQAVRLLLNKEANKLDIGMEIALSTKAIYSDFQPNNSAYEDLKSGANLNIISDKSIIKALNKYFNKVEELKSIIMVNGKHAVDILFAHDDNFANGSNQASIKVGRFATGLEEDVKKSFLINDMEKLSPVMQARLLNESIEYVSVNTRQVELFSSILSEINILEKLLHSKCN